MKYALIIASGFIFGGWLRYIEAPVTLVPPIIIAFAVLQAIVVQVLFPDEEPL